MKRRVLLAVVLACVGLGRAMAAEGDKPTLAVARVTASIEEGSTWGEVKYGFGCTTMREKLTWGNGAGKLNVRGFEAPARTELKRQDFPVAGDSADPFATEKTADLAIGATITALHGTYCAGQHWSRFAWDGSATVEIDWQLYSKIERRALAKVHTTGAAKVTAVKEGYQTLLIAAVNDSLDKFIASNEFTQAVQAKSANANSPSSPPTVSATKTAISLIGSAKAQPTRIGDAVGSVVLVLSGVGHGSGFLVSSDGYLMTAEHVVGSDKYVKIRWSDGLEGVGEVVRSDKRRDVALIKTDPRNRPPLALHRAEPDPGDTVFAIGAPLDVKNQSTVTRGVASANRIMDGFSFIQSDVTISPGNSGGPLLDEKGEVLGICDLTYRPAGVDVPTGINYFIPIDDALRFLAAEPR